MKSATPKPDKLLSLTAVILLITTLVGITATMHYRNLYLQNPKVKTVERQSIIHQTEFDPARSQAYTCTPQAVTAEHVGMVCISPGKNIQVNCTTTPGEPVEYFC